VGSTNRPYPAIQLQKEKELVVLCYDNKSKFLAKLRNKKKNFFRDASCLLMNESAIFFLLSFSLVLISEILMSKIKRVCPNCKHGEMVRVQRRGFLQEHVFPKLGFYPWECPICRELSLQRSRGSRRKHSSQSMNKGAAPKIIE
jgi:hypothetical protein